MGYSKVYLPVVGVIKRSTEKAILLVIKNPEALTEDEAVLEVWFPRSQIGVMTPLKDQEGNTSVMVNEWLMNEKGMKYLVQKAKSPVPLPAKVEVPDDDIPF